MKEMTCSTLSLLFGKVVVNSIRIMQTPKEVLTENCLGRGLPSSISKPGCLGTSKLIKQITCQIELPLC